MDAVTLIRHDHENLKRLLEAAQKAEQADSRAGLFAEIRSELAAHERMEEEVLYTRLRDEAKTRDTVLEGFEEHHVADVVLDEMMEVDFGSDVWAAKLKVLKEGLEHHIEEEESEMLPAAEKILGASELETLGRRMAAMKGE